MNYNDGRKRFNKLKARKKTREFLSKDDYKRLSKLITTAINDQDGQPLQYGIPEDSEDVEENIYYVIGKSGEIYEQNPDTIDDIFDDIGAA